MNEVSVFLAAFIPVLTPEGALGWGYVLQEVGGERFLPILTTADQVEMIDAAVCVGMAQKERRGGSVEKVVVNDVREDAHYHSLLYTMSANGKSEAIELRPSDAIAFALEGKTPIFVKDWLFEHYEAHATEGNKKSIKTIIGLQRENWFLEEMFFADAEYSKGTSGNETKKVQIGISSSGNLKNH